jgi:hypothetical protein
MLQKASLTLTLVERVCVCEGERERERNASRGLSYIDLSIQSVYVECAGERNAARSLSHVDLGREIERECVCEREKCFKRPLLR